MDAAVRNSPPDIGADDFSPPACVAPLATYYIYDACATSKLYAMVTVTSLGSAANVNIVSSAGTQSGVGLGTYSVGPFPSGTPVNVTVESPGNPTCNLVLTGLNFDCATNGGKNALSFDGVNDGVNCGNAVPLNLTAQVSLEAWILSHGLQTGRLRGKHHQ